jgi:hypothetical protein
MFFGGKELILFEGVVEDRNDPLFLGRVRVRAIGFHDGDKLKMPTDTLPWAMPLLPADDGRNVVGYKEGDFVAGYFRDGEAKQYPIVIGKIPGIPEKPANPDQGYNDPTPDENLVAGKVPRPPEMIPPPTPEQSDEGSTPTGKYQNPDKLPLQATSTGQLASEFGKKPFPYDMNGDGKYDSSDASLLVDPDQDGKIGAGENEGDVFDGTAKVEIPQVPISRYPLEHQLKESVASRLARNENTEQTLVARKKGGVLTSATATHAALGVGTDQPSDGEAMGEPETPYAAQYPYNHVYESESGHVIEYDDTPLAERLHFFHRSGTFKEVHPDGKQVDKAVNDRFDLSLGNSNYISDKSVNVTAKEVLRALGAQEVTIESGGVLNEDSGADRNLNVGGNANTKVGENVYTVVEGDVRILIKGDLNVAVEGDIKVKAKGDLLMEGKEVKIEARGSNVIKAGKIVTTQSPLTFFDSAYTSGNLVAATISDFAGIAGVIDLVPIFPPVIVPSVEIQENDADNKSNLVSSSTPKEGYLLNEGSLVKGSLQKQDLYKPASDSDGKAVVLSLSLGQQPKLYEALPTGELEDVKLTYKSKDGAITNWDVKRPVHKKGRFIEAGRYSGNGNGGRDHWRFSKSGAKYPTPMILQIGGTEYLLVEPTARHEVI